jgi:hypothetical protein
LDWNVAGNTIPVVMMENIEYGESKDLSRTILDGTSCLKHRKILFRY